MTSWLSRRTLSWRTVPKEIFSSSCFTTRKFIQSRYFTISAPSVEYGIIEGVESIGHYRLGRYFPVHIDDRLNKQYRIVHKLGHGSFSTVWLAIDETTRKYVAIKVGTVDAERSEINILSQMAQNPVSGNMWEYETSPVPIVLDQFEIDRPQGTYPCLVTLPARCSLSLAAQLVHAVSLVHNRGYAHGDLHLGNIFLQLRSSLNVLSVEQLYDRYDQPEKEPVIYLDPKAAPKDSSFPSYVVHPIWLGLPGNEVTLGDAKLMLSDFGVAFSPDDKSRFASHIPLVLHPPEALFEPETPLTLASDIWSLGCVIFELLSHRTLLDGYFLAPQDYIIAQQVDLQGLMPPLWWSRWEERPKWYSEDGRPLSQACDVWSWERTFEEWVQNARRHWKMETLAEDEVEALIKLLRCMLAWKPSSRPDTLKVLESEWMTRWALPAYQKGLREDLSSPNTLCPAH
ncbi:hypothetical protein E4U48_007161 [Claviceps purpurea]|nr:hypothetical protein E4U48_007161 [Claviceps purpurea]